MIVSPKSDTVMKELFRNKKILRYFLSDILDIPLEEIASIHRKDPFLRKRRQWQKLGILDVVLEMNRSTKVNIELQVKFFERWDKRQIFYLARLYSEDLVSGAEYGSLKKCVGISILDFDLTDRPECHSVYTLKDEKGNEFSDVLEIHVLELKKKQSGNTRAEEWITFFNVETEEDLDMIRTNNPGILEAIGELRRLSHNNPLYLWYEAYLKRVRDERAWRNYVVKEAQEAARVEARAEAEEYQLVKLICKKLRKGTSVELIAKELEEDLGRVRGICKAAKGLAPDYDAEKVMEKLKRADRK
jgi:predicted transposase/invertase (TIGR01784 family)